MKLALFVTELFGNPRFNCYFKPITPQKKYASTPYTPPENFQGWSQRNLCCTWCMSAECTIWKNVLAYTSEDGPVAENLIYKSLDLLCMHGGVRDHEYRIIWLLIILFAIYYSPMRLRAQCLNTIQLFYNYKKNGQEKTCPLKKCWRQRCF